MKWTRIFSWALLTSFLATNLISPVSVRGAQNQITATLRRNVNVLQGTSLQALPLLYAPGSVQLGSSVSHWDPSATPNLLMEPNISPDLAFGQLDVTPLLLQDLGWEFGTSSFNIIDGDEEGTGFTDPSPFAGAPGNDATTLGEARQNLIAGVLDAWANTLQSSVDIDVLVTWLPLPCSPGAGATLAAATTTLIFADDQLPREDTWYHAALAESLAGMNLTGDPAQDGDPDILVFVNSEIDKACLGEGTGYYYGLDGNHPNEQLDLAPVILHELAHGLGFANFTNETNGQLIANMPSIYDHFTRDQTLERNWVRMSADERVFSATNDKNLVWSGVAAGEGAGLALDPGTPLLEIADTTPLFVSPASFGAPITEMGTTGELACAFDEPIATNDFNPGLPSIRDACDSLRNPEAVAGKLAIVDRGNCSFLSKAANLEAAGAIGLLIVNNFDSPLTPGGDLDPVIGIPVAGLSSRQGEFLRSQVCPAAPPADLIFGQWVNGELNGQENSVRLILRNRTDFVDTGIVSFLNASGETVSPSGEVDSAAIPYEIAPFGTTEIRTSGTGTLQSGVVEVRSDFGASSALLGTEIFDVLGKPVSVPSSVLSDFFQTYVSLDDSENSGLALYNPHPELWSRIDLVLTDSDGESVDEIQLELAPRQQVIGFLNEPAFFAEALADFPDGFKGTLDVSVSAGPKFAMLGLIQRTDGSLLAVETTPF